MLLNTDDMLHHVGTSARQDGLQLQERTASRSMLVGAERFAMEYSKTPVRATTVPAMFADDAAVLKNMMEAAITTCIVVKVHVA
jgi:hypothetical protein